MDTRLRIRLPGLWMRMEDFIFCHVLGEELQKCDYSLFWQSAAAVAWQRENSWTDFCEEFILAISIEDISLRSSSSSSSCSWRVRRFLFLDPQNEVVPSISSSVVQCSFVLLVCNVMLVLVFYLCPSSVRVVATFTGTVSAKGAHPYRKACRSRGIKVAVPPLGSPCDRPVTYPGDSKHYS